MGANSPGTWYSDPKPWPVILTIANLWKNIGYSTILYLAAITGIDATQYEAASIDGATKWQQVLYVTLPHLKTMIIILFIMNIGKIFNADFVCSLRTYGFRSVNQATRVIDTYVYTAMNATGNLSLSSGGRLCSKCSRLYLYHDG